MKRHLVTDRDFLKFAVFFRGGSLAPKIKAMSLDVKEMTQKLEELSERT
jgi:hypothetical protein